MSKCKICKKQATIETLDGKFCREHLPDGFCPGCGQLVAANEWHELSIEEFGVCGDCLGHKLSHIANAFTSSDSDDVSVQRSSTFDDEIAFVLDDLEPIYNAATMEMTEASPEGETPTNLGTAIRRIQKQLGFTDDEDEEY